MGVSGDRELIAKLRAIEAAGVSAATRKRARQKALQPMEDTAKTKLVTSSNVETRALVTALTTTEDQKPNTSVVAVKRGRRGKKNRNPVRYAHLVEYGTSPHWQPNRMGGVMHPGARPFPFMRPAFEMHRENAAKIYFGEIWAAIAKAAK